MKLFSILSVVFLSSCSQIEMKPLADDIKKVFNENLVTEDEISYAFKELLTNATVKSISSLSAPNGFLNDKNVAIPFPDDAQKVEQTLRKLGFNSICDDFNNSMNLAAEKAVIEAGPLFIDAISELTFVDSVKLLNGNNSAITDYLRRKTNLGLVSKFNPIVEKSLETTKVTKNWKKLINKYNKLPLVKPVQLDLVEHVTEQTVDGLFIYISKEESIIRKNPSERTTELIKKVFSQVDQ